MNPKELRDALARDENIIATLKKRYGSLINTEEFIEISYDLRAGTAISAMEDKVHAERVRESAAEIAGLFHQYGQPTSLLEAGVGEATTMAHVLHYYQIKQQNVHGFDLCWSRIYRARGWLAREGLAKVNLCTASLARIPFADNSFDVVYTVQSVDANGGREAAILAELYRVASRYLILLEPAFELAAPEAKARMLYHGYCQDLPGHAGRLGMKVVEYKLFPIIENPLNPIGLIVIEKEPGHAPVTPEYRCPKYQVPLVRNDQVYYSPDSFTVYPVIAGIPCLRAENGITATLYAEEVAAKCAHDQAGN